MRYGGTYYLVASHADNSELGSRPQAVAIDSTGNVYIADEGNDVVDKVTPNGTYLSLLAMVLPVPRRLVQLRVQRWITRELWQLIAAVTLYL